MAVDVYPDEEGHVSNGYIIGFCKASAAIPIHSAVYIHATQTVGDVYVTAGAADGDSIGVALKEAAANDRIPILFRGVVKMIAGAAATAGDICMNDASATYVIPIKTLTMDQIILMRGLNFTGTYQRLGMLLQGGDGSGSEVLVLVGRVT